MMPRAGRVQYLSYMTVQMFRSSNGRPPRRPATIGPIVTVQNSLFPWQSESKSDAAAGLPHRSRPRARREDDRVRRPRVR